MIKKCHVFLFAVLTFHCVGIAQDIDFVRTNWRDASIKGLSHAEDDSTRLHFLNQLGSYYKFNRPDSAIYYGSKAVKLAMATQWPAAEIQLLNYQAIAYLVLGDYTRALKLSLAAKKIAENQKLTDYEAIICILIGNVHLQLKDSLKARESHHEALLLLDSVHSDKTLDHRNAISYSTVAQSDIGKTYNLANELDSALHYQQSAYDTAIRHHAFWWATHGVVIELGKIHQTLGNRDLALTYFHQSLSLAQEFEFYFESLYSLAQFYQSTGPQDSCIYYALKSLDVAKQSGSMRNSIESSKLLSDIYKTTDREKALGYSEIALAYNDSLNDLRGATSLETLLEYDEQKRQYEIETAKSTYQSKVQRLWIISISGALISAIILALVLYRNYRNKQRANVLLKEQKEEIQSTLEKLEATQSQLIQSEKMASLGELTAGIAHEIQNPLNFVKNFSEVNSELLEELEARSSKLKAYLPKGKGEEDLNEIEELFRDIRHNEEKIKHHGQRADSIVKGMLQHSRTSNGQKEPTDINALADEYLRLAYHGLRAKEKSFNADFSTDLDENLPKINVIPQDIGRVLLNLINNAFQAVSERSKKENADYKPLVSVSTGNNSPLEGLPAIGDGKAGQQAGGSKGGVFISIKDNGPGIPENIKDKIFQPFFTTKPTGSGTGLGLSLSYDIVKAHGGELKVESAKGEGSEFIIRLPVKTKL